MIEIFDEVERDGEAVSALLFEPTEDKYKLIDSLTREQKVLFLKYAAKTEPNYFDYYATFHFWKLSDQELSEMVDEVDWMWK